MKLFVAMAVMDRVDRQGWQLEMPVTVRREDLSLYVQPLAKLVTPEGYRTTIGDLVRRAVVDSDSAATDILIARLGGPKAVQAFLDHNDIRGVRIDRDERHLQTEIAGLTWKPEYVDAALLDRAMESVPEAEQDAAFARYRADVRDTATPKGMTNLLHALASGRLLSPASTRHLLGVMEETTTFPDRLKAGVPEGWILVHKTGSSGSHKGVTVATNDVGVITAPDGGTISVTAFVADSTAPSVKRSAIIADIARAAVAHYR